MKYIKHHLVFIFLLLSTIGVWGQSNKIYEHIQQERGNGSLFVLNTEILQKITSNPSVENAFISPTEVSFLRYSKDLSSIKERSLSLQLTLDKSLETIDLYEVKDSFYDYQVITSSGESYAGSKQSQRHFRGIVRGDQNSIVSMSFFNDEVVGLVSTNNGNYNLGMVSGSNDAIVYNDRNLKEKGEFNCTTPFEESKAYDSEVLFGETNSSSKTLVPCVRLYYETEFDMFQNLGSVNAVENYVTALNNQVATLYQNESIPTFISDIFIWNTTDPYTASGTAALLSQFQSNTSSMNGDLGQLLTFRNVGGGRAAGFNGICNSNINQKLSVSGNLNSSIVPVPTYSWNVMVVTHEFGHLFGSRHTHACVWNGNSTAIDGCSGQTEGGCPLPGIPSNGGTIMSYCHQQSVGINFTLGFGPQPGNVIRNRVANGSCLQTCDPCEPDLVITQNVFGGENDIQEAENTVTATNIIFSNGNAEYDADTFVRMNPGFHAKAGSTFIAFIDGCTPGSPFANPNSGLSESNSEETSSIDLAKTLLLYPNPTTDFVQLESDSRIASWELTNQLGNIHIKKELNAKREAMVDLSTLITGVYFLKVSFTDGEIIYKTVIKE